MGDRESGGEEGTKRERERERETKECLNMNSKGDATHTLYYVLLFCFLVIRLTNNVTTKKVIIKNIFYSHQEVSRYFQYIIPTQ